MALTPYLTFDGDCEAAFEFYRSVFGGEYASFQRFADGPPDLGVEEKHKNRIMHVTLPVQDGALMGSDTIPGRGNRAPHSGFALSFAPNSRAEADRVFGQLSEHGEIEMDMQETFWNSYFGMCKDRFGVSWMVNLPLS